MLVETGIECRRFIMNYTKMLNAYKGITQKVVEVTKEPDPVPVTPVIPENTANKEDVNSIMSLLTSIKEQIQTPEGCEEKPTLLSESEVENVLNILMELQENLFFMTPLSPDLVKAFVWNIPRGMYDLAMINYANNGIPALNPLYWFYLFCIDTGDLLPEELKMTFAHAVSTAIGSVTDEDFEQMTGMADQFEMLNPTSTIDE